MVLKYTTVEVVISFDNGSVVRAKTTNRTPLVSAPIRQKVLNRVAYRFRKLLDFSPLVWDFSDVLPADERALKAPEDDSRTGAATTPARP